LAVDHDLPFSLTIVTSCQVSVWWGYRALNEASFRAHREAKYRSDSSLWSIRVEAGFSDEEDDAGSVPACSIFTAENLAVDAEEAKEDEEEEDRASTSVSVAAAARAESRALTRAWIAKNSFCSDLVRIRVMSRSGRNRKRRWNRGRCRMSTPMPRIIQSIGQG